jgi:hypothetical protein
MPVYNQIIVTIGIFFGLVLSISTSSFVYCLILRKRGMGGTNRINSFENKDSPSEESLGSMAKNQAFHINMEVCGNMTQLSSSSQQPQVDERKRQAEIHASILSLKTNLILTLLIVGFMVVAGVSKGTLSIVLLSIVKTWTPIITMIVNFHIVRDVTDNLALNLLEYLSKAIRFITCKQMS